MLKTMYKRRIYLSYIFTFALLTSITTFLIVDWPITTEEWFEYLLFYFITLAIAIMIPISHVKYNKVKNLEVPKADKHLIHLDHLVIQSNVSYIKELLLFTKKGQYVGKAKVSKISWFMWPFTVLFKNDLLTFIPWTYTIYDHLDQKCMAIKRTGWGIKSTLTIKDEKGSHIGTYVQDDLRMFNIRGNLLDEDGQLVLPIKADLTGSFRFENQFGDVVAEYYQGRFPHEYTTLFRDMENHIVYFRRDLSKREQKRLYGVLIFLFLQLKT
ncbi:hypothetical protein [Geomicrobium sp. JCM 19038]|uniref:hypothetical protein n=1 Tax=Geomicrobium sp. JCM 19038 TaxID=1460635 RepID=UPI00045F2517|nr:hypothetical protein [Geomicrobium sp. JCM 19038]GAK06950.1 hypothetical protein JCM19038_664 [Geomicrobium sp. JCM 19038]